LASTYATTTYTKIGTSYQGRDLMVLKITNGPLGRKPVIFYEGHSCPRMDFSCYSPLHRWQIDET
jgi:hypothetical protein